MAAMSSDPPFPNNHENSSSSASLAIGIVGFGSFAQFLAKTILKQGHSVSATSRSDYTLLCNGLGISFFREIDRFLEANNDVIMICTSIMSFQGVVDSMPFDRLTKPTLFVDVLSVKEHPKQALIKFGSLGLIGRIPSRFVECPRPDPQDPAPCGICWALPEDVDLLCTHPMFGPESGKDGWSGLSFMFEKVRIRNQPVCSSFLHIFESEGCRMLEMSCEEHDRLAARSQFLSHTVGRTLAEMEIESTPIDTKSFQSLLQLKESTVKDSFDLFKGLFVCNRFAKEELDNLEKALGRVKNRLQEQETAEDIK